MTTYIIITIAAFFAGILNALAGGGSFLTFPALVYAGVPVVAANATSTLAVFPGYVASALGFKDDIAKISRTKLSLYFGIAVIGGVLGSLILLATSDKVFSVIVPWLLLAATGLFAFGDWLRAKVSKFRFPEKISMMVVSIYGGYFNGGLGIILLAVFSALGLRDLDQMNGLKAALSVLLSAVSVATFAIAGVIYWSEVSVMMVASMAGGYAGARLAKALPKHIIRGFIILVGLMMSAVFFLK
jgi:uncharacterized membrane protein YfcA